MYNQKKLTIRKLVLLSILLAIIVVSLGAYARLTHAGLGCPDWPGCYGMIDVPVSTEQLNKAKIAFPDQVVDPEKAWNEMIHRYFAGALGLLILAIAFLSFRNRGQGTPLRLPLLILAIVTFQAALGMWTVTMKLMPIVVMGHLLGGFTTLCLLFLLYLRLNPYRLSTGDFSVKKYGRYGLIGIVILTAQIALGGWTSSNYAALTCTELPICQSGWVERLTFEDSFDLIPPEKETYEFGHLDHNERLTIHVVHRIGAIVTSIYLAWLLLMVFIKSNTIFFKKLSALVAVLLFTQISLGISNIWFSLPLAVAVGHNVVAACLMLALIMLTYSLRRKI
ncbi:MAG: COX15/CtaA family protein [Alteromonadaceae bacterium]|tara:strand:- start:1061 stop:2068 length:1008 start_codon:yes stop_codon:yes gene_type:complete